MDRQTDKQTVCLIWRSCWEHKGSLSDEFLSAHHWCDKKEEVVLGLGWVTAGRDGLLQVRGLGTAAMGYVWVGYFRVTSIAG